MDRDSTFSKVIGRPPNESEKARLERICGAWNTRGNEGLLALVFVLHFGSDGYQRYPARCAESVRRTVQTCLPHRLRLPRAQPVAAAALGPTVALAAAAILSLVPVGLLSLALGASDSVRWNVPRLLVPILAVRCGWAMFVAMALPVSYVALWGWSQARDGASEPRARRLGWAAFTAVNCTVLGWLVLLLSL